MRKLEVDDPTVDRSTLPPEELSMSSPLPANAVLDRVYLEIRAKLLDIAASLDRVARADETQADETGADGPESIESDPRLAQIAKGIDILSGAGLDRAERIQMLFSDPYVPHWNRRENRATNGATPHN
jgi:hypothetical protein